MQTHLKLLIFSINKYYSIRHPVFSPFILLFFDCSFFIKWEDIIFITIAAVICGAETWNDIENCSKSKEPWLRQFFSALAPESFEEAFIRWVKNAVGRRQGEVASMDGKSLRGTREGSPSKLAVHTVSACSDSNQPGPGQVKADEKTNEITAIPNLLEVPTLQGSIVPIDATGCQKETARLYPGRERQSGKFGRRH